VVFGNVKTNPQQAHRGRMKTASRVLVYAWLFVAMFIILFPLLWIVSTSLKGEAEVYRWPPTLIPDSPNFDAYSRIWALKNFSRFFWNSTVVASISTLLSVALACLAGYGFSRFQFRGSNFLQFLFLVTQMVPAILLLLPYFILMKQLSLLNTYTSLVLAYTSFSLPFCTWMLKGFFDSIPAELDDAAMIDGCSRIQVLVRVVMPLALPGVAATAVFSFLVAWNHYLFAMGLATDPVMYTLPVGISSTIGEFRIQWNELMAGAVIASFPAILVYSYLERYFVQGLTGGAVKG
jgi:ABC-type glycerol-3-phosphate transport system permease component